MSKQINDGGPAFPLQSIGPEFPPGYTGMRLRDYFAASALAGMELTVENDMGRGFWYSPSIIADRAYAIADEMIKRKEDKK